MARRIYSETVKDWAIVSGISGVSLIFLIFAFMFNQGLLDVHYASGDMKCAGTEDDPCYAIINFTAKEDIFIYPVNYDPYGRDTPFDFDPAVKDWKLQRSWGSGWRDIPLNQSCTGTWCGLSNADDTRKFSVVFREGKTYSIRIVGYKYNPSDSIHWSLNPEGYWLPIGNENCTLILSGTESLTSDKLNDLTEFETEKSKSLLSYKEIKDKKVIGFEPVYDTYECFKEVCNYINDTKEMKEVVDSCWNETYEFKELTDKKGKPIYEESNVKALEYGKDRYNFINKGCSICNTITFEDGKISEGKLLLCLSNQDGYSDYVKECYVEDGVSYSIKNLETDKIIETKGNFEVQIET